ncbi:hypothetical protein CGMCC3_g12898 [Colletotrichum fructicola]|nr:uncharacterized protein CGMCC3_g12898 [Colletotrichum fructicola]KAE9570957.1 hypothetical protein CGMCC3_g12898 [Colletotrichum fructicola]
MGQDSAPAASVRTISVWIACNGQHTRVAV